MESESSVGHQLPVSQNSVRHWIICLNQGSCYSYSSLVCVGGSYVAHLEGVSRERLTLSRLSRVA
eukprot:2899767-Rhodomonas_salina.1